MAAEKKLVREAAARPLSPRDAAEVGAPLVLLALGVGFVVGLVVWGMLRLSTFLTELVWVEAAAAVGQFWFPVAACTAGGLAIGLWSKAFDSDPKPLEHVLGEVKRTGGYRMKNAPAGAVAFLLPLAFGGSVGPEAGLTGLVAAGCTWIADVLKRAGVNAVRLVDAAIPAVVSVVFASPLAGIVFPFEGAGGRGGASRSSDASKEADAPGSADASSAADDSESLDASDYVFSRSAKITLYVAAAFGALAAAALLAFVFGRGEGLPRFERFYGSVDAALWAVPLALCGWALALVQLGAGALWTRAACALGRHTVLKPVIGGFAMGCVAVVLPNVLFSGEEQTAQLMVGYAAVPAVVLVATGVAKCVVTPLCLSFGWRGGVFFPAIFAGVSFGYGAAALLGLDPVLAAAVVTASLLSALTRKPLLALGLLALCFPVRGILWMGLAVLVGVVVPMPSRLRGVRGGSVT